MKIICVGDSLTCGYPYPQKDSWTEILAKEFKWEMPNFGVNGESSGEILTRVMKEGYFNNKGRETGSNEPADKAAIMCGSNDFVYGLGSVNDVLANTLQMALMAKREGIQPKIIIPILCNPKQAEEAWLDGMGVDYENVNRQLMILGEELKRACANFDFDVIDLQNKYKNFNKYTDGLHPTKEGYVFIANSIKEELR